MADGDAKVGYRKPPKHSQFKSGQSGNPSGRPRGAKGLKAELKAVMDEMVTVTKDGRSVRLRRLSLVLKALAAKASSGNVAAADKLLALVVQVLGIEEERPVEAVLSETDRLILAQFLGGDDKLESGEGPE